MPKLRRHEQEVRDESILFVIFLVEGQIKHAPVPVELNISSSGGSMSRSWPVILWSLSALLEKARCISIRLLKKRHASRPSWNRCFGPSRH